MARFGLVCSEATESICIGFKRSDLFLLLLILHTGQTVSQHFPLFSSTLLTAGFPRSSLTISTETITDQHSRQSREYLLRLRFLGFRVIMLT